MKRTLLLVTILFCIGSGKSMAQWSILPQVSLGSLNYSYKAPNPYKYESGSGIFAGLDVLARYNIKEALAFDGGIGLRYHSCSDSLEAGNITYVPVFVGVKWGEELFIEGRIGYNMPLNSSGLGYITGWFASIGAGIGSDNIAIGATVDMLHLFGSKTLLYVPTGYLPVNSGYGISLFLEFKIPIND